MYQLKIAPSITNREGEALERYLQDIGRAEMISPEEEVELSMKIQRGDQMALSRLVRANLRFVVSVAKQYQSKGLGLIDIINEGNVGLIKAAQRFDHTRGFKFISYAVWWIRQSILQAITEKSRLVRLPSNQEGLMSKVKRFRNHFMQENQREPNAQEIATALEVEEEKVDEKNDEKEVKPKIEYTEDLSGREIVIRGFGSNQESISKFIYDITHLSYLSNAEITAIEEHKIEDGIYNIFEIKVTGGVYR